MTINQHLTQFGGYQVKQWEPDQPLADPSTTIYRIAIEWDDKLSWVEKFHAFLKQPKAAETQGLVVGWWGESDIETTQVLEALVSAHQQLSQLKTIFYGDITYEENEISWIEHTDMSPLLAAYAHLEHFGIRGANNLSFGQIDLPNLRTLIVQSGGLDVDVVREVMSAKLPNLEHLELYLGTDNYGANSSIEDLSPLLDGALLPNLKYLGLKNSDYQDEIAQVFAEAPILDQLEELDISLGVLTDEGGQALINSPKTKTLKKLHMAHHFMTESMQQQLDQLGIEVDHSDPQDDDDDWRFVALGE